MSSIDLRFGLRFRRARETRGLTVYQIASAIGLGVTANQVARWDAGKSRPPSTLRRTVAAALDVPAGWLFDGTPPSPFPPQPGEAGYDPTDPNDTPMRLRDARAACGLTIEMLARMASHGPGGASAAIDPHLLRAIEAGAAVASPAVLAAIAAALDVTAAWLSGETPEGGLAKPQAPPAPMTPRTRREPTS
jgi:transcriptional regulator with XRE-family HTH domain